MFGRDGVFAASVYRGEETLTSGTTERDVDNTAFVLEALLPLPLIPGDVRGGWFTAENMARPNLGHNGVTNTGSSIVTTVPKEIGADGWWGEVNWNVIKDFTVGAGYGRTDDDKNDVIKMGGTTARVLENEGWWLHANWSNGPFLIGVLYGEVETTRIVPATGAKSKSDAQEFLVVFRFNL
jgi:hypothetical protein